MLLYAATIFVSAFLLFQIQPVIARTILPWFGGSSGVWTACMLFFQLLLLGGYLYAHGLTRWASPRIQATLHGVLLAGSLALLPVIPDPRWKPVGSDEPTLRILGLLAVTIGLPYFLLSTTGPLLQAWFVRTDWSAGRNPYRLYALSNAGSMLALLTYPVAVEPYLTTNSQAVVWSWAYAVFVTLCGLTLWLSWPSLRRLAAEAPPESIRGHHPTPLLILAWIALPACASSLLLAITNHLTQNIAAVPFLWVLPLALYLLTFVLCFDGDGWYRRNLFLKLFAVALGGMTYALSGDITSLPIKVTLPLFLAGLFIACMVCHGELVRLKPAPRHLTQFYLMVAAGGAMGGVFVGLVAPNVFAGYYELPISIAVVAVLVLGVLFRDPSSPVHNGYKNPAFWVTAAAVLALCVYNGTEIEKGQKGYRVTVRNFYGGLKVHDYGNGYGGYRTLTHGAINHGEQYLDPNRRRQPTTYYGPISGVGLAIRNVRRQSSLHVGVIGLGTGTLAAYCLPGDVYRFYEINPQVLKIARTQFYFLKDCPATVDVIIGDARLSLEREPPQNFDVLAVDAFSSDSIPVHLLTKEAFELYFHHLKPNGVLAVHISNKYLNLQPVVEAAAREFNKYARLVDTDDDENDDAVFGATWILLTADISFFEKPELKTAARLNRERRIPIWTDDFSSLYRILR